MGTCADTKRPSSSEVAALIPWTVEYVIGSWDIIVRRRGTANAVLDNIKMSHRSYNPLSYVIPFLDGRDSWYQGIKFQNGNREKGSHPYFLLLAHISGKKEFTTVRSGLNLFQHYLVDQFRKLEADRRALLLHNQKGSRAESHKALQ